MFDSAHTVTRFPKVRLPVAPEKLKDRCLPIAELWVLKRRAKRPWLGPQRLPVVARVG